MLGRVFDLFVQGERPRRSRGGRPRHRPDPGAQNLVELHGGTRGGAQRRARAAAASSRSGCRSRSGAVGGRRAALAPGAARRVPAAGRRVLVVDDNVDAAESLAVVLRDAGHEVATAHDGAAALAAAEPRVRSHLLDIALPDGLDGYELARRIRADPRLRDVTLVALTGFGQEEDRRRAVEAGFDRHLVKPVDLEVVGRLLAAEPGSRPPRG